MNTYNNNNNVICTIFLAHSSDIQFLLYSLLWLLANVESVRCSNEVSIIIIITLAIVYSYSRRFLVSWKLVEIFERAALPFSFREQVVVAPRPTLGLP
jgi:hypothetical protein